MAASGHSSLLLTFKSKIEESVALVPDMAAGEKLEAVQFWNVVSERLQEIVNSSAADINALALKMDKGGLALDTSLDGQHSRCSATYAEPQAFAAMVYGEESKHYDNSENTQTRQLQYMSLPPVPSQAVPPQQPVAMGESNFSAVSLDHPNVGDVSNGSAMGSGPASLILSVRGDSEEGSDFLAMTETQGVTSILSTGDRAAQGAPQTSKSSSRDKATKRNDHDADWVPNSKSVSKAKTSSKCKSPLKGTTPPRKGATDKKSGASCSESDRDTDGATRQSALETGKELTVLEEEITDDPAPRNKSEDVRPTEVIVIQTRKKPKKWKECEVCLKKLPTGSALKAHMWTHRKPFNCTECGACFSSRTNLTVHQRRHTGEKPYGCPTCSATFSTHGNLKRHIKTHSGEKPWECSQCRSHFTEKKTLTVHMRRHTGEKPYQCHICQRRFAQKGILQSHLAMHLGQKAHLCEHCGKAFRQRSQLRLHALRHQGVRKYSCSSCPSKFLTKGDLERHNRTHTGERPFVCDLCGKTFTRRQSLTEHTNRHYGLKPYECKRCGKAFVEMSACYKHIKHHSKSGCTDEDVQSGMKVNAQDKMVLLVDPKSGDVANDSVDLPEAAVPRDGSPCETTAEDTAGSDSLSDPTPIDLLTGAQSY